MSNFFILIISSLAVFRLSELVAYDEGPFEIFKRIRNLFRHGSQIDKMLECIYCNGIWWSLLLTIFLSGIHVIEVWAFPLWWLGIAGGAIVVTRTVRERD
jgi:hypothetical protein